MVARRFLAFWGAICRWDLRNSCTYPTMPGFGLKILHHLQFRGHLPYQVQESALRQMDARPSIEGRGGNTTLLGRFFRVAQAAC